MPIAQVSDIAFTVVFVIDVLIQIIALGAWNGIGEDGTVRDAYLRDKWHRLDAILVFLSVISLGFPHSSLARCLRALRAIRFVVRVERLKVTVDGLDCSVCHSLALPAHADHTTSHHNTTHHNTSHHTTTHHNTPHHSTSHHIHSLALPANAISLLCSDPFAGHLPSHPVDPEHAVLLLCYLADVRHPRSLPIWRQVRLMQRHKRQPLSNGVYWSF